MYEGGYRIPTHVDGETVNPAWGLTKANKPRKRLALACLDCREKKIKCEPGVNSCVQCEKAKRPCRRAPLQSSQTDSPTPPVWQSTAGSPVRKGVSDPTPQVNREPDGDPMSKRPRADPSPPNVPSKKHRSASPLLTNQDVTALSTKSAVTVSPVAVTMVQERGRQELMWEEDPFAVDPDTTLHLLDLYFAHVNNATYCIFPMHAFMHWVRTCQDKCQNERMTLYAMLAVGSIFARDNLSGFGKRCAVIASDAITAKVGYHNLCVVHTRMLMGIYHSAKGSHGAAWDYIGAAIRASAGAQLRFNTEEGCLDDRESLSHSRVEYSLTRTQLAECKRRTFWSCFLMDRYDDGTSCAIVVQDIFLRLPCTETAYEDGLASDAPHFNNGIIDPVQTILTPSSQVCPMAWLALVAAIWGDVLNFTNRAVHRGPDGYRETYESFYSEMHTALQGWSSRLPDHLQYGEANIDRSLRCGYAGTFISMHVLHHFTLIRLNRYVRRRALMPDLISRNIQSAHHHARSLLGVMRALHSRRREIVDPATGQPNSFVLSMPFIGNAVMSAIDVVGAGGLDSNLGATLEAMNGGLGCVRELASYWNTARDQLKDSEKRYYQIQNIVTRPFKALSGAWLGREWGMKDPLEKEFSLDNDCIYADDDGREDGYTRIYFDALKEAAQQDVRSPRSGGVRIV